MALTKSIQEFVIPVLNRHMANKCTKFEVFSFSRSKDILGGVKIYMGHMAITTPLLA